ncbi:MULTISPECIES: LysR family transcriptional regulator [Sphingobium]|uniref:LysR family transcriptional regulator n=1 Tax=Sphingobium sp. MI1205 TaxID=407020 RepID=UPI00076FEFAE|nr:LysR family transcriptional regulator [Sphingobium sp. MI1205]AMK19992.1 transcriptional regulator [Sphingobium sp. MI1205]
MNFRRLQCFLAAADEEHFGRAADRLNIVHSAFSRQIQHLEADLGVELFERFGRRVKLSAAGVIYADRIRGLMAAFEKANEDLRAFAATQESSLRMGLQEDIGRKSRLAAILRDVRLDVPGLTVSYVPMPSMDQPGALQRREIDIGLIYGDPALTKDVEHLTVVQDRYLLALQRDHRLAGQDVVRLEELADENFVHIATDRNPGLQQDLLEKCRAVGFEPRIANRAATISGILTLLATEGGVAWMPELIGTPEDFKCVVVEGIEISIPVEIIWRRGDKSRWLARYIDAWRRLVDANRQSVVA